MVRTRKFYFFSLFIPVALLFTLVIALIATLSIKHSIDLLIQRTNENLRLENVLFQETMRTTIADAIFLRDEILEEQKDHPTLWSKNVLAHITKTIASFSETQGLYDQIRFLKKNGQEIIRVNNRNHILSVAPKNKLQNKSSRFYFTKTAKLKKDQIYISPLDLNVEFKKIEIPFRPMIRFGIPVITKKDQVLGQIILNFDANRFIQRLENISRNEKGEVLLISQTGHFAVGLSHQQEWGHMIPERSHFTLEKFDANLWKKLQSDTDSLIKTKKGLYLVKPLYSNFPKNVVSDLNLTIIWYLPWNKVLPNNWFYFLFVYFVLLFLIGTLSWIWSLLRMRQIEYKQHLEILAKLDQLTNIPNRHELMRIGHLEFERAKRYEQPFCLLMLDIDHFKKINDQYGHLKGDEALQATANTCKRTMREIDTVARYGGEEFVVILPNTNQKGATMLAERLRKAISEIEIKSEATLFQFTVSIGVTTWRENDKNIESVIKRADDNLYTAKENGRNRVVSDH